MIKEKKQDKTKQTMYDNINGHDERMPVQSRPPPDSPSLIMPLAENCSQSTKRTML